MRLEAVSSVLADPRKVILRLHWQINRQILNRQGTKVMNRDWDNLIILDACRYDLFAEHNTIDGELSRVLSGGSHTVEFLHSNFGDGDHADTVYIAATPQVEREGKAEHFFRTVHAWQEDWNEELGTVPPEAMAERVRETVREYPNKQVIAHFVQPHYPFIGDNGRAMQSEITAKSGLESEIVDEMSIWDHLSAGNVSESKVHEAYVENFKFVNEHVADLVDDIDGKTVVTSDQGNSFGRWGVYGHPPKKFLDELVSVPWLEPPYDARRSIKKGNGTDMESSANSNAVEERLEDLGYKL